MSERFRRFAAKSADAIGSAWAFILAVVVTLVWLVAGPFVHFSDTWQLCYNTITTLSTGLIVFLIQNTQNRTDKALNVKLDELLVRLQGPRSEVAHAERLPERELERLADEQTPNGAADYVE